MSISVTGKNLELIQLPTHPQAQEWRPLCGKKNYRVFVDKCYESTALAKIGVLASLIFLHFEVWFPKILTGFI